MGANVESSIARNWLLSLNFVKLLVANAEQQMN
jgi:hypothetical protein